MNGKFGHGLRGAVLAVAMAAACGGSAAYEQELGTNGGTVSTPDGVTITVPSGALTAPLTISVTPAPDAPVPPGATQVGDAYTFGPEGTTFAVPVKVALPFDPTKVPAGVAASSLVIYTAPAGSSSYTALATVVADATHVWADTPHFSTFLVGTATQQGGGGDGGIADGGEIDSGPPDSGPVNGCSGLACPVGCAIASDCLTCIPESSTAGLGISCNTDVDCCTGSCVMNICTASSSDGGVVDGGCAQGMTCASDAGISDGGFGDGGPVDGGVSDAGPSDGGRDAGMPDAGPTDAGIADGGAPACPADGGTSISCAGVVVNVDCDPQNCGGCGVACASGQACANGVCI